MTHQPTLADFNVTEGLGDVFVAAATISPLLIPLILFAFFIIIFVGSFFQQQTTAGRGHAGASFAVAGYATVVLALTMTLLPGLINTPTLSVTLSMAGIGTLWLFLSREQ